MKEEEVFIILKNILDIEEDLEINENFKSNININDEDLSEESINNNIDNNANIDFS